MTKNDTQRKQVLAQIIRRSIHLRATVPAVKLSGGAWLKVVMKPGEERILIYREGFPGASRQEAVIVERELIKVLNQEYPSSVFETVISEPTEGPAKGVNMRGYSVTFQQVAIKPKLFDDEMM